MILDNFKIEEKSVVGELENKLIGIITKRIYITAHVIIDRLDTHWSIPVNMHFDYKNNGSYLENYKKSIQIFLEQGERVNENYIVDPERDSEWSYTRPLTAAFPLKKES